MKLFFISILLFAFNQTKAQEISLFNSQGIAVAYVDTDDDDLTIYLWSGKPVAYISDNNIYGFNGKHLGWWVKGVIRDHEGDAVGATKAASSMNTEYEPYKSYKEYKPYKSYKEYAPYKPYWSTSWSNTSFKMFLLAGKSD
ncbi:4-fold beta flower protein [Ferruginibacter sp. HRS2-29]|uniref:4-fold beta flower protein n=1 Tax=Ferruginibacter sp. HRS2-29 TaxID=2487334 RepID=UPI0020CE38E3|nr:hypothetical protein [Ferruginibacter sp. HRS2-29]MCP9751200.1 hypothetical protein [Ferruginibacter sp. HRS2-29]